MLAVCVWRHGGIKVGHTSPFYPVICVRVCVCDISRQLFAPQTTYFKCVECCREKLKDTHCTVNNLDFVLKPKSRLKERGKYNNKVCWVLLVLLHSFSLKLCIQFCFTDEVIQKFCVIPLLILYMYTCYV